MSSAEFAEWMAYDMIEPLGPRRLERQIAALSAMFANSKRDPRKTAQFEADDFLDLDPATAEARRRARLATRLKVALKAPRARKT